MEYKRRSKVESVNIQNPFMNFLRDFRMRFGYRYSVQQLISQAALRWRKLTNGERRFYNPNIYRRGQALVLLDSEDECSSISDAIDPDSSLSLNNGDSSSESSNTNKSYEVLDNENKDDKVLTKFEPEVSAICCPKKPASRKKKPACRPKKPACKKKPACRKKKPACRPKKPACRRKKPACPKKKPTCPKKKKC